VPLIKADDYQLGNGYKVPEIPFYVGGYFSADYRNKTKINQTLYRLNDIAVLGYGSYEKFSYLVEFEAVNSYVKEFTTTTQTYHNANMHAERVYVDYTINDNYQLRIGKFTSPIGYWNMTPINVLRDTTSNPFMSYGLYPKFTTGIQLSYTQFKKDEISLDLIIQNNDDLDKTNNNIKIHKHYAVNIERQNDLYSIKINGGYFHTDLPFYGEQDLYYTLAAFSFDNETIKLTGEIANQFSSKHFTIPYTMYLQGSYNFFEKHYAIFRAESYKTQDKTHIFQDTFMTFGYTYRPLYPVAFKIEYQHHSQSEQNQFLASFSVLF